LKGKACYIQSALLLRQNLIVVNSFLLLLLPKKCKSMAIALAVEYIAIAPLGWNQPSCSDRSPVPFKQTGKGGFEQILPVGILVILQLHHNHEIFLFLTVLLLFAQ
jgi:hypothetical protein